MTQRLPPHAEAAIESMMTRGIRSAVICAPAIRRAAIARGTLRGSAEALSLIDGADEAATLLYALADHFAVCDPAALARTNAIVMRPRGQGRRERRFAILNGFLAGMIAGLVVAGLSDWGGWAW